MIKSILQRSAREVLKISRLQYCPVRVRSGLAAGARWTLYPWTSYWRGTHEPAVQSALHSLRIQPGWSCWDLGSHYGIYSIGFAMRVGPSGEVSAFEPNPLSFDRLTRHRDMNNLSWLKLFNSAVSNCTATGRLYTYGSLDSTSTHLPYDGETDTPATQPIVTKIMALDDLVSSGQIRLPNLIKIDVEGHGHHALAGALKSIRSCLPMMLMGFHSPAEVEGTKAVLGPLGYTWHPIEPNPPHDCVGADFILRPPSQS